MPLILVRRIALRKWNRRVVKKRNERFQRLFSCVEGGTLVVRVSDFHGQFEFDVRSFVLRRLLLTGAYEPELVQVCERYLRNDCDALDIGANVGLYTVLFSKRINCDNRVLAVEASPWAAQLLRANLARNNVESKVIVYEGAAVSSRGQYCLNVIAGMDEYSSLGAIGQVEVSGHVTNPVSVNGETIDNLVGRWKLEPGFLKLDIEGGEYNAFQGAVETLQRFRPIIVSELADSALKSFGCSSSAVIRWLENAGYTIINLSRPNQRICPPFNGEILALPNRR